MKEPCENCSIKHVLEVNLKKWANAYKRGLEDGRKEQICEDVVSRQAVLEQINFWIGSGEYRYTNATLYLTKRIQKLQPVTQQPKMGRWIAYEVQLPDRTILNYRCSVCGRKLIGYNTETLSEAPFCHCGAKMQEVEE